MVVVCITSTFEYKPPKIPTTEPTLSAFAAPGLDKSKVNLNHSNSYKNHNQMELGNLKRVEEPLQLCDKRAIRDLVPPTTVAFSKLSDEIAQRPGFGVDEFIGQCGMLDRTKCSNCDCGLVGYVQRYCHDKNWCPSCSASYSYDRYRSAYADLDKISSLFPDMKLLHWVITLPDAHCNLTTDEHKRLLKLVHDTINKYFRRPVKFDVTDVNEPDPTPVDQIGGVCVLHKMSSTQPHKRHPHVEFIAPNVGAIRVPTAQAELDGRCSFENSYSEIKQAYGDCDYQIGFVPVQYFVNESVIKRMLAGALREEFGWDDIPDTLVVGMSYIPWCDHPRVLHALKYIFRPQVHDVVKTLYEYGDDHVVLRYYDKQQQRIVQTDPIDKDTYLDGIRWGVQGDGTYMRSITWFGWLADCVKSKYFSALGLQYETVQEKRKQAREDHEDPERCPVCNQKMLRTGDNLINIRDAPDRSYVYTKGMWYIRSGDELLSVRSRCAPDKKPFDPSTDTETIFEPPRNNLSDYGLSYDDFIKQCEKDGRVKHATNDI